MSRNWAILPILMLAGCSSGTAQNDTNERALIRLAVTTSTYDTGLIQRLTRKFEETHSAKIDIISSGTGKALELGRQGDVDVVLVHSRSDEDQFMQAGHGKRREDVMYNWFYLLGPPDDPGRIRGKTATAAFKAIRQQQLPFISRGDQSGTHKKELMIWESAGGRKNWKNYDETGTGMGKTLIVASELKAYVLSDSGTYLAFQDKIKLVPMVCSGDDLRNTYGLLVVQRKSATVMQNKLAMLFADFLVSSEGQSVIRGFRTQGKQLFFPQRPAAKDAQP